MSSSISVTKAEPYMIPVGHEDDHRLMTLAKAWPPRFLEIMKEKQIPVDADVLDVGCGNGYLTACFAKAFPDARFVGFDNSQQQLEVCRQRSQTNIVWENCDVYHLDELKERYPRLFDVVHCRFVLNHLTDPTVAMDQLLQVVKPGGLLILQEASKDNYPEIHPRSIKAIDAFWKMAEKQMELQKTHLDTSERLIKHITGRVKDLNVIKEDVVVKGAEKKSTFRMSVEHYVKMLPEKGLSHLFKEIDYEDPQQWIKEMKKFEKDDSFSMVFKSFTTITAIKD
ncbi:MAG: class I SAM-dependent methyltransferase [Chlamydiia bacterium]|nr:class I SAM-dependent methyltransferase [Chlamydiia bacterium]